MLHHTITAALFAAAALAGGAAHADPPDAGAPRYRFEVTIAGLEPIAGQPSPITLQLELEPGRTGVVSNSRQVPLQAAGGSASTAVAPQQVVGARVQLIYSLRGHVAVTRGAIELSSPQPAAAGAPVSIVMFTLNSGAVLTPDAAPTTLGSGYDVYAHRTYTVTIAARRAP